MPSRRRLLRAAAAAGLAAPVAGADPAPGPANAGPPSPPTASPTATPATVAAGPPPKRWSERYRHGEENFANALARAPDGGCLLAGLTGPYRDYRTWLVRVDATGRVRWERTYGSRPNYPQAVVADDGGFVVAGATVLNDPGWNEEAVTEARVRRVDCDGEPVWRRGFPADGDTTATDLVRTADGFAVAGGTGDPAGDRSRAWLATLDRSGRERRSWTFAPDRHAGANAVVETGAGLLVAGGSRRSDEPHEPSGDDAWAALVDGAGRTRWRRTYGSGAGDRFEAAVADGDGAVLAGVRGYVASDDGTAWLVRLDAGGDPTWERAYDGVASDWDWIHDLHRDGDGFLLAGTREPPGDDRRGAWLLRAGPAGRRQWTRTYLDGDHFRGEAVVATPDGGYLLAGSAGGIGEAAGLLKLGGDPPPPAADLPRLLGGGAVAGLAGLGVLLWVFRDQLGLAAGPDEA